MRNRTTFIFYHTKVAGPLAQWNCAPMFSQEQLLLHICLFVLLKSVFSGRCRLKSTQTDGETLCRAPQAKDARSGQVYSAAGGAELWTFRFWCYTARTAPASPPRQRFSGASCEVKALFHRSSSLPRPCLLCFSWRLCEAL